MPDRPPWVRSQKLEVGGPQEKWELYNIAEDFSQGNDLAAQHPDKLKELQDLFDKECWKYNVYPLSSETTSRSLPMHRPSLVAGKKKFTYYPENVHMPELAIVNLKNRDVEMTAHLDIPEGGAEGVVICQGGNMAGWSLYVKDNKPVYYYNWVGHDRYVVASPKALPAGPVALKMKFDYAEGQGLGQGGTATLFVNDEQVAQGRIEKTVPFCFSMSGETFDVGIDTGAPVGPYPREFPFTGTIHRVDIEVGSLLDAIPPEKRDQMLGEGMAHAAMASQ